MRRERSFYVYIMSNPSLRPFYTGIANSVHRRVAEHQEQTEGSYTAQYHITRLLYYEVFHDVRNAIDREKKIKRLSRANKLRLIRSMNPKLDDLSREWVKT